MKLQLFGLKNCDTCKKAMKWRDAEDVPFVFVDIRLETPGADTLQSWIEDVGGDLLINRRSTTWRELSDATRQKVTGGDAVPTLLEHPTLIKRPVLVGAGPTRVGFDPKVWSSLLS